MSKQTLLVIGAAGDVGQGIVAAALGSGRQVIASGRNREKLERIAARHQSAALALVTGDIATEEGARALWDEAIHKYGSIHSVVVTVSATHKRQVLMEWSATELHATFGNELVLHFIAAKICTPRLNEGGVFIGIGGGTADFIMPKMAHVSMSQAAQRMMYRGFARERQGGAEIRELMVVSMVNGESSRQHAKPEWLTDIEIGRHVCSILDAPASFPGPILQLKSREQVGKPE
jgi:NAD(P)-dependent dehydrogenase (short-subunit alcohol dehydrogenase family)